MLTAASPACTPSPGHYFPPCAPPASVRHRSPAAAVLAPSSSATFSTQAGPHRPLLRRGASWGHRARAGRRAGVQRVVVEREGVARLSAWAPDRLTPPPAHRHPQPRARQVGDELMGAGGHRQARPRPPAGIRHSCPGHSPRRSRVRWTRSARTSGSMSGRSATSRMATWE